MDMSPSALSLLRNYIRSACGLALSPEKEYLIKARIEPLAIARGCHSFDEFVRIMNTSPSPELRHDIISAITTNETSFFRDDHPWQAIKDKVLPEIIKSRRAVDGLKEPIKIWSAAASTGQEALSLCMSVHEYITENPAERLSTGMFEIHATDISLNMVKRAREGKFTRYEVNRGLSPERRDAYFTENGGQYQAGDNILNMVSFYEDNLLSSKMQADGFDLILCRNVLIYFDNDIKTQIFKRVHKMLSPHGWLLLGATENTYGITDKFASERHGNTILYRSVKG